MHKFPTKYWIVVGVVAVALLLTIGMPLGLVAPIALVLVLCPLVMGVMMYAMMKGTSVPGHDHQAPPSPSSVNTARPSETTSANQALANLHRS